MMRFDVVRLLVLAATVTAGSAPAVARAGEAAATPRAGSVTAAAGWAQVQGGATHTGFEPGQKSITAASAGDLQVAWTQPLPGDAPFSQVAVTGGTVYAAAGSTVSAFSEVTGAQLWQSVLGGPVSGTPAVQNGLVLVAFYVPGNTAGYVAALSDTTGALIWQKDVGPVNIGESGDDTTSVTATSYRAYVSTHHSVVALAIGTGRLVWKTAVPPAYCWLGDPAVADGMVVVDTQTEVSALNASNGTLAWQDTFGSTSACESSGEHWLPVISQGTVYAGLFLDGIAAINLRSGAVVWDNTRYRWVSEPLTVTGQAVIADPCCNIRKTGILALRRSDGTALWREPGGTAQAAAFGGLLWGFSAIKKTDMGVITARSRFTGQFVAQTPAFTFTAGYGSMAPVVDAGRLYVKVANSLICFALPESG
jgi:outer membrane protein assembly factor BamB